MISSMKGVAALLGLSATVVAAGQQIQVQIDGHPVYFADVMPEKENGIVFVPIRSVFEQMGASVDWDQATQTVTVKGKDTDVVFNIGNSEATVNGNMTYLDLPPMIIGDRAMVPMRFLGNALGTEVTWMPDTNVVAIDTSGLNSATISQTPQALHALVLRQYEVVPVTLDTSLSTTDSYVGETFTATLSSPPEGYGNLPPGTKIEGHVTAVQPMNADLPAILDLTFDRLILPNGDTKTIDGSLVSMDSQYVTLGDDGVYEAQNDGKTFPRMVFVGYGSPDGVMIGANDSQPLDSATLGYPLDEMKGHIPEDFQATDISLPAGTAIGVRIDHDKTVTVK